MPSQIPSEIPSSLPSSTSVPSSTPRFVLHCFLIDEHKLSHTHHSDGVLFFLMQDQTAYLNEEEAGCVPPRGKNAMSNVEQCRNGEGAVEYSFYNNTNPLLLNGCLYTYIRYAPCDSDEATTKALVSLNTTVDCDTQPPVDEMNDKQFEKLVDDFINIVKSSD